MMKKKWRKFWAGTAFLVTTTLAIQPSQAVSFPDYTFGCKNSVLQAIYQLGSAGERRLDLIEFKEDPERCEVISTRFRTANEMGQLKFLRAGQVDSEYVIYGWKDPGDETPAFLLTLIRSENNNTPQQRQKFIQQLSQNLRMGGDFSKVLLQE